MLSYISTWEFLETLERWEKHLAAPRASLCTSHVFLKIPACLYNSTMHSGAFFISVLINGVLRHFLLESTCNIRNFYQFILPFFFSLRNIHIDTKRENCLEEELVSIWSNLPGNTSQFQRKAYIYSRADRFQKRPVLFTYFPKLRWFHVVTLSRALCWCKLSRFARELTLARVKNDPPSILYISKENDIDNRFKGQLILFKLPNIMTL